MNTNTNNAQNPANADNNPINSNDTFYGKNAVVGNEGDAINATPSIINNVGQTIQLDTSNGGSSLSTEDKDKKDDTNITDNKDDPNKDNDSTASKDTDADKDDVNSTQKDIVDKPLADQMNANNDAMIALGKDLVSKGVDFAKAIEEYQATGDVSKETYEALQKAGYPKEVIAGFIESRRAIDDAYTKSVYDYVGGEKEYHALAEWMRGNLSKSEIQAFNKVIDDGDTGLVKLMLDGIQAKRVSKQGTRKPTILGNSSRISQSNNQGFASKQDMIKAMSDKRYGVDRDYTLGVERKMMFTNF